MSNGRTSRPFTPEDLAKLRQMHAAGISCDEAAAELGRTSATIMNKATQLKLGPWCGRLPKRKNSTISKPEAEDKPEVVDRNCLCCGRKFRAQGKFIKMCGDCKRRGGAE